MEEEETRQACLNLMETADAVYLSTFGEDGFPHTRMLSNLRNTEENPGSAKVLGLDKKDFVVYFATGTSSVKMQQIRANPRVSAYFCNPREFRTLMLGGEVEVVEDLEFKRKLWQDGWEMHWPKGAEDPELTVLKLSPTFARGWYKEGPFEFKL
ncbi:MAG: pyridoxamine 5'-phosphate oxidase family protein [Sedimentisphaerales bacterium]|jgi:general stress protein 26